jgi:plastocyanin
MGYRTFWTAALSCALLTASAAQAATHEVQVISFRYEPAELTIQPGDTVIWRNGGGSHNVVADDESFDSGPLSSSNWTYTHQFDTPGDFRYFCEAHGGPGGAGMAGRVIVSAPQTEPFAISYGIGGTWYNPATTGQGFLLEVIPSVNSLALGWFTWSSTTTGQHDWISALGPIVGDSATVNLQHSVGGRFNDPAAVTSSSIGTATFKFTDCQNGTVTFNRSDTGQSGTIPIQRLTPTPAACIPAAVKRSSATGGD